MNDSLKNRKELEDLVDGYLADSLDEARFRQLEELIRNNAEARKYFVLYCGTHADLEVLARSHRATSRAMATVAGTIGAAQKRAETESDPRPTRRRLRYMRGTAAAVLLLVMGMTWWVARRTVKVSADSQEVAWLANAQDCRWVDSGPTGGLNKGVVLRLDQGLAEVRFRSGATVVLQGPSTLELLSTNSAMLFKGKLSARVPETARGFQVFAPQGRVVDLGTEFGLAVSEDGSADVVVFKGKVEAYSEKSAATPLVENGTARISAAAVVLNPLEHRPSASDFTRQILSAATVSARVLHLTFVDPVPGSLADAIGVGTGLDTRLPGTGTLIPPHDPNLRLDPSRKGLHLITTRSDINQQFRLGDGEYPGMKLSTLGFTGSEDFEVTLVIPNIPSLAAVGQFGLYAGARSDRNIRGGLISRGKPNDYQQFLVNNNGGRDHNALYIGVFPTGTDVQLTLGRYRGKYAMSVTSLSTGASSTLSIAHPEFLDNEKDLYVGLFGANTGSEERRDMVVKEMKVTVWSARKVGFTHSKQ